MILLGNFINGIALVLQVILGLIEIVLVLTAIFSWFPQARYNQTVIFLNMITNIILKTYKKICAVKIGC
ncbi:MAG: YggT family protein [Bdellovibrionota bacterium]